MTRKISFHRLAEQELNDASLDYEGKSSGLGGAFLDAIEQTLGSLQEHPRAAREVSEAVRRKSVHRFPYSILYSVRDDEIRVLAVAHDMRRPLYWRDRT